MLAHVQFPITDFRSFSDSSRLTVPSWPAPLQDEEFIRGAGTVRYRPSGGLAGWIAEDKCCNARRALRLRASKLTGQGVESLRLSVAFRRFYFDGLAVGKLEIGFSVDNISPELELDDLLNALIEVPVCVPKPGTPISTTDKTPLLDAGDAFAEFYVSATTKHGAPANEKDVCAGTMSVFVTAREAELPSTKLPGKARAIELKTLGLRLFHWWKDVRGRSVHIWVCLLGDMADETETRKLRVYLLRMNAESDSLTRILKAIAENKLAPAAKSPAGEALQSYLNDATKNILGLSAKTRQFAQDPTLLAQVGAATESVFSESARDALKKRMEQLAYRANIVRKAVDYASAPPPPEGHAPTTTVVNIGLINNPVINMNLSKQTSAILAFIFGVVFVAALLVINIFIPDPTPTQYETFRIILALAAGGVGAMIPGILNVDMTAGSKFALRAGGALAVFVIVYFFQPGLPPA